MRLSESETAAKLMIFPEMKKMRLDSGLVTLELTQNLPENSHVYFLLSVILSMRRYTLDPIDCGHLSCGLASILLARSMATGAYGINSEVS